MPRKKKTALQYELTYHIPLTDSGWPKRHNIAPTKEAAIRYLQDRYGHYVKYRVKEDKK